MERLAAALREHSRRWLDKEELLPKLDAVLPPPREEEVKPMEEEAASGDF